jgi:hypothetical protein
MTDTELLRSLARLMGWEVYTEREGRYDRWQRHLVNDGGAGSCFIDLDGKVWIYDGASVYINAHERLWRPLHDMNDAMTIVRALQGQGWEYAFGSCPEGDYAHFSHYERRDNQPWPAFRTATADGLARAICLAALPKEGGW